MRLGVPLDLQEVWWLETGAENDRQQQARWTPAEVWCVARAEQTREALRGGS